jgi:hypothetical protein
MELCEVFKTGTHKDKNGKEKTWTVADLDRMVSSYNEKVDPAPITIDHIENKDPIKKGPAFGWVEKLERIGNSVFAKFKQVVPEFARAVDQGLFRTRSIAVNPDGTLRHVSWLGANKPAIKGLADFSFSSDDCLSYSEGLDLGTFYFQEEKSVNELEILKQQLAEEQQKNLALVGQVDVVTKKNQELASCFSEAETRRKRQDIDAFIETGIKDAKILPAWKENGLAEFMAHLEGETQEFQFSEGKKQSPADWFKNFIMSFSEHSLFSEFATKGKKPPEANGDTAAVNSILKHVAKKGEK